MSQDRTVKVRDSDGARAGEESGAGLRTIMLVASSATLCLLGDDDLEACIGTAAPPAWLVWSAMLVTLVEALRV
jgi:hypothetical protein